MNESLFRPVSLLLVGAAFISAQTAVQTNSPAALASQGFLRNGSGFIQPSDLPPEFARVLVKMGGRMTSADKANVTMMGAYTDATGTQQVQVSAQAPGYLRFEETGNANPRVITFDGSRFQSKNGRGVQDDTRVEESLMAYLPETILLQLAGGGGLRRIGSDFRTDNGRTPNYSGPYWTLYGYAPAARASLSWGHPLQQSMFIAIDQATTLISEVRVSATAQSVTQTKFNNWFQQSGQWYPGEIVRLENGAQAGKLTIQQVTTSSQLPVVSIAQP